MIDAFEEDRQDLIFSGVLECPSEERIKTGARENAEQAKPAIDAMEKDTKPFLEVIPPFKKQLTPTIQLDPSTNDAQRKAKKEELEYERKKSLPQSSTTGVEKGSADSARYVCCIFFLLLVDFTKSHKKRSSLLLETKFGEPGLEKQNFGRILLHGRDPMPQVRNAPHEAGRPDRLRCVRSVPCVGKKAN
jgi:hypothetical protein